MGVVTDSILAVIIPTKKGLALSAGYEGFKYLIWHPIWGAIEWDAMSNNPPAGAVYNDTVYVFFPSPYASDWYIYYTTFNLNGGTAWTSAQKLQAASQTGAGAITFNNQLYVFWQGVQVNVMTNPSPNGTLYYMVWGDQFFWQINSGQTLSGFSAGVIMSGCPTAVAFNDKIYVFYQGPGPDGLLWYTSSGGGPDAGWAASTQVSNVGMSASPSAVVFTNPSGGVPELYVFHEGGNNNGQLWYNVMNASGGWAGDKQIQGVTLNGTPSAIVSANGMLFVFYPGSQENTFWYIYSTDGSTWTSPVQTGTIALSNAPSLVEFNSDLFCMMMGPGNSGDLWWAPVSQGSTWSLMTRLPNATMSTASESYPGTVVFNNAVYCFTEGSGNLLSSIFTQDSGWAAQTCAVSGNIMACSPAPVVYNNEIWVFFQGSGANSSTRYGYMYYLVSQDGQNWGSLTAVPNQGMSYTPSAVVYQNQLYIFSTAYGQGHSMYYNVYSGNGWLVTNTQMNVPNIWYNGVVPPSAIVYNGNLYLFFIGQNWGICYTQYTGSNGSNEWSDPVLLNNYGSPNNQGTGYFSPVVYNDGNGPVLAVYFQGYTNNGLLYYMSTTDPSSAGNWTNVTQAGISQTTPKAPNITGGIADALAGLSMLMG